MIVVTISMYHTLALPTLDTLVERVDIPPSCNRQVTYSIESHKEIEGDRTLGPFSCPSSMFTCFICSPRALINMKPGSRCALTIEEGYEVGVAVSIGADLGLDLGKIEGLAGGLSIGVEMSTSTSVADAAQVQCPTNGTWTCGLLIVPGKIEISGQKTVMAGPGCSKGKSGPYTASYPAVTDHKQNLWLTASGCPNYPYVAQDGAPPLCFKDCPR